MCAGEFPKECADARKIRTMLEELWDDAKLDKCGACDCTKKKSIDLVMKTIMRIGDKRESDAWSRGEAIGLERGRICLAAHKLPL